MFRTFFNNFMQEIRRIKQAITIFLVSRKLSRKLRKVNLEECSSSSTYDDQSATLNTDTLKHIIGYLNDINKPQLTTNGDLYYLFPTQASVYEFLQKCDIKQVEHSAVSHIMGVPVIINKNITEPLLVNIPQFIVPKKKDK